MTGCFMRGLAIGVAIYLLVAIAMWEPFWLTLDVAKSIVRVAAACILVTSAIMAPLYLAARKR